MNKKDAYYFSHDSNAQDDPKCMMLIDDLGMEGYGIFWALIEKLRAEKDYSLPISICGRFARRWATSEAKIHAVVSNYGLFEIVDETFFSLRLKRSMEERSTKARLSAEVRWGKNQQLTEQNQCERIAIAYECSAVDMRSNAIKGKESKENEIKEVNNTAEKSATNKTIEERKKCFGESLTPFLEEYGKDMLNAFYRYWTEHNEGGKKMRFEMEKVFNTKSRLVTWSKNNFSKSNTSKSDNLRVAQEAKFY